MSVHSPHPLLPPGWENKHVFFSSSERREEGYLGPGVGWGGWEIGSSKKKSGNVDIVITSEDCVC